MSNLKYKMEKLKNLYVNCGKISDSELANKIRDLDIEMNRIIIRIIARQFAFDYLKFGSIKFSSVNGIISEERMLEECIIDVILEECLMIAIEVEKGINKSIELKQSSIEFKNSIPEKKQELLALLKNSIAKRMTKNYLRNGKFENCSSIPKKYLNEIKMMIIRKIESDYFMYSLRYPKAFSLPPRERIIYGYTRMQKYKDLIRIKKEFIESCYSKLKYSDRDR